MRIGVVREIKPDERRVALTPSGARTLVRAGHDVCVERSAGVGSGFPDEAYLAAGAELGDVESVWRTADLLVKVKEPVVEEYVRFRDGQILFTYLHLAVEPELSDALVRAGTTAIAYETVEDGEGRLPLLAPMSEVAGRLAGQMGAWTMSAPAGGRGILPGGVPGVAPARVLVIGGGVVGTNAALIAAGLGADVIVIERSLQRIRQLDEIHGRSLTAVAADEETLERELARADLVIGAVLIPGARAPRLVSREMLRLMQPGSVVVDVAIDQGGCLESSRPTTHSNPVYEEQGIVHYCVANMPGAVPITSTRALTNATFPYIASIASRGLEHAILAEPGLRSGINIAGGEVIHPAVRESAVAA